MAESGGRSTLLGCVALAGLGATLCCGGGVLTVGYAPEIAMALATSDHPLDVPVTPADPARQEALELSVAQALDRTGTVRITPEELNVLLADERPGQVHFTAQGDTIGVLASVPVEEGAWLNVDASGRFELEHGYARSMSFERLVLSDWDVGPFLRGEDVSQHFNQRVVELRAGDPILAQYLDATDRVTVEGGALVITVNPELLRNIATQPSIPPPTP